MTVTMILLGFAFYWLTAIGVYMGINHIKGGRGNTVDERQARVLLAVFWPFAFWLAVVIKIVEWLD